MSIASDFQYGANFKIGGFCIIEDGCIVGDNVEIGNYVLLKSGTVIGDNCFIDSYVKSSGHNRIGNNCTIRYNATIARNVTIGNNVFISPNVMTIYSDHRGNKGSGINIGNNVFIGTGAVIGMDVQICDDCVIGAMVFVRENLTKPQTYTGIRIEDVSFV